MLGGLEEAEQGIRIGRVGLLEPRPLHDRVAQRAAAEGRAHLPAPVLLGHGMVADAHELERLREVTGLPLREHAVESRQQEPSCEVAAGAEDDEGASGHPSTLARRPARCV